MTHFLARIVSAVALAALATGCAVVPGDPYYAPQPSGYGVYEQPAYIYGAPPSTYIYRSAPPAYYGPSYYDRNDWRERERAQREREARQAQEARRDQDARRDRERDQARDQGRREQAQRDQSQRDQARDQGRRDQAQRDQAQRQRRDDERRQPGDNTRPDRPDQPRWRNDAQRGQGG